MTALSGPQNGETVIDSDTFTLTDQFNQTATVDYTVWEFAPGVWQWKYVVTNNSINNHAGKSNSGMRSFSIEADPAAGVYDAQTSLYPAWDGSKTAPGWGVTVYYPTSGLMPGNTATFTFKTPPRPIVPLPAAAGGGGMIPTIAEGQVKGPTAPPTITLNVPKFIDVNANNDNFKPIVVGGQVTNEADRWLSADKPRIPKTRDFAITQKTWQNDPQLLAVTITVEHSMAGTVSASVDNPGSGGVVKLWKSPDKDGGLFTSKDLPVTQVGVKQTSVVTVYAEGVHESINLSEITVKAKFVSQGVAYNADNKTTTVIPVINSFKGTPGPVGILKYGNGVVAGMAAGTQSKDGAGAGSGLHGMDFKAYLVADGQVGRPKYVQVMNNVVSGNPSAFELANGKKANLGLKNNANYPLNDAYTNGEAPIYLTEAASTGDDLPDPNPNGVVVVKTHDSPGIYLPPNQPALLKRFDLTYTLRMHQTWTYDDLSVYSIAYIDWTVVLKGKLNADNIFVVEPASKVEMLTAGDYERSNEDPVTTRIEVFNALWQFVDLP